jgi:hypothetical protein
MQQLKYTNRRINLNSRGYSYLNLPKQVAAALGTRVVDLVVTDSGILILPKDDKGRR